MSLWSLRRDIKRCHVIKCLLKGRLERGDRIEFTAWASSPSLCANRARPAMNSMWGFMGYNRKIFPSLSGFSGHSVVFSLSLLLGSVCFPLPNQPKLLSGASARYSNGCADSHQILISPSAIPLPTAHSFLYYKRSALPRDGRERGKLSFSTFFSPKN